MKKALIVGASGYLGNYLFKNTKFESKIGTYHESHKKNLVQLDISDKKAVKKLIASFKPDIILYAAGITNVDTCEKEREKAMLVNAQSLKYFLNKKTKLIYFSTDYVFDGTIGNYAEDTSPNPINTYGVSKLLGESITLNSNSQNVVIRVSGLVNSDSLDRFKNLIPDDDRFSNPICISDVLIALNLIIQNNLSGLFHVAGSSSLSRYEFKQIISLFKKHSSIKIISPTLSIQSNHKASKPKVATLTTDRIANYGWQPQPLSKCIAFKRAEKKLITNEKPATNKFTIKAILIDCIGGILTKRTWQTNSELLNQVDALCGRVSTLEELDYKLKSIGITNADITQILTDVTKKYTINPSIWSKLPSWKNQYKLALVNNGLSITFRNWVKLYGLENIFHVLVNSSELKISKYSPEFYLTTAKMLGVLPSECLLIDDDISCIQFAADCGMKAIQTIPQNKFPLCEHHFSELELCQILPQ